MILTELASKFYFLHTLYSIILMFGLYQIGTYIFSFNHINRIFAQISEIKYQKVFISINFILILFYPIILFSSNINIIPYLGISIFLLGILNIFRKLKKINFKKINFKKINFKKINLDEILVLFTLTLFFFLSLSPNTHGDSLGYHFVVAKKLLATGQYFADITHFHSLLSGSGEIIIAIGLFFGSDQFGSLVQYSGLISIFGIFKKIKKNDNYFYFLLFLTSPVILFLSSTAKPQLFHICSTAVVFTLYFFEYKRPLNIIEKNWRIIISVLVLIVSVSAKFNFLLSTFLLCLIIFHNSIKNKIFLNFIFISAVAFLFFYLPIILWKFNNFGGNIFQYSYSPVPLNIIGLQEFKTYLVGYGRGKDLIEILFTTKLNQFTNSIGIAFLFLIIINFKERKALIALILTSIYILILYNYGQLMGRSFLEPLLWILLICARYGVLYKLKIFEFLCRAQAFIVIGGIIIGIYSLFPGSLTETLKEKTLSKNANGYALFKWANSKLNREDVAFSMHRSISLGKSKFIATDFVPFVDFKDERSDIFVEVIFKKDPKYLLTYGYSNEKPKLGKFINCVDELIYYKKNVGRFEARNPLNRGRKYDGYIFKITKTNIPTCIKE